MTGITGRDIIMSANNNEEVVVFPVVPDIDMTNPQNNETFETADQGYLSLIGENGLREFTIGSIFPIEGSYQHMRPGSVGDPFIYVDFINKWRAEKVPFRVITSKSDGTLWFNVPMVVDNFDYHLTQIGSVEYQLSLSEYRFYYGLV